MCGGRRGQRRSEALFQCGGLRVMGACNKLISRLTTWITYSPFSSPKAHTIFFPMKLITIRLWRRTNKKHGFFIKQLRAQMFNFRWMAWPIDVLANLKGLCPSLCNLFRKPKNVFASTEFQKVMVHFRDLRLYCRQWNCFPVACSHDGKDRHMDKNF